MILNDSSVHVLGGSCGSILVSEPVLDWVEGDSVPLTELRGGGNGTLAPFDGTGTCVWSDAVLVLELPSWSGAALLGGGRGGTIFDTEGEGGRAGKGLCKILMRRVINEHQLDVNCLVVFMP